MQCPECSSSKNYIMNVIINKFLLAGDKFMPEMLSDNLGLLIVLVDHLLRIKKEFKSLNKLEIEDIFTKMNYIKLVFSMIWLMGILKI